MVFGPSPLLPVVNDPDGKQHDPLFTPRVESAVAKAQELNFPPDFIFGSGHLGLPGGGWHRRHQLEPVGEQEDEERRWRNYQEW